MHPYRWNTVTMEAEATCERCSRKITLGEIVWERTNPELPGKAFYCTAHFIPPPGKVIVSKPVKKRGNVRATDGLFKPMK